VSGAHLGLVFEHSVLGLFSVLELDQPGRFTGPAGSADVLLLCLSPSFGHVASPSALHHRIVGAVAVRRAHDARVELGRYVLRQHDRVAAGRVAGRRHGASERRRTTSTWVVVLVAAVVAAAAAAVPGL